MNFGFILLRAKPVPITETNTWKISCEISLRWMSPDQDNSGNNNICIIHMYRWVSIHRSSSLQTIYTVYPKKYAHGLCFAVLCCGYTLNDFPISIRLTSLALWQSNDCPSASKATLMNMDKYFMWIHYERRRKHNKAKHNKTVCRFLGIYCNCHIATWLITRLSITYLQILKHRYNMILRIYCTFSYILNITLASI